MPDKMKAIVKVRPEPNGTELKLVDIPQPGESDVLIKVRAASICGTDVHIFNWDAWAAERIKLPLLYGHEFAGDVVQVGKNITSVKVGDYVSGECHIGCGHCYQCKNGQMHICQNVKVFGIDVPGIFAKYACIPAANVWKNDPSVPPEICSIQDPLGNAVHCVYSTDVKGKDVVIIGLGPIGIMTASLCKNAGAARIFAVEKFNDYRAQLTKKIGVEHVFKETSDAKSALQAATNGKGADVVFEMSGATEAVSTGLDILRAGGEMIMLGVYTRPAAIDLSNLVVFKCITIKGIYGRRMFADWQRMRDLLGNPAVRRDLETIITHKFSFDEFFAAMEMMRSGKSGKVVLQMKL